MVLLFLRTGGFLSFLLPQQLPVWHYCEDFVASAKFELTPPAALAMSRGLLGPVPGMPPRPRLPFGIERLRVHTF